MCDMLFTRGRRRREDNDTHNKKSMYVRMMDFHAVVYMKGQAVELSLCAREREREREKEFIIRNVRNADSRENRATVINSNFVSGNKTR